MTKTIAHTLSITGTPTWVYKISLLYIKKTLGTAVKLISRKAFVQRCPRASYIEGSFNYFVIEHVYDKTLQNINNISILLKHPLLSTQYVQK